ncbi:MAG: hydroxyacylglutathione hydrolase [Pseudomonadota bacterium]
MDVTCVPALSDNYIWLLRADSQARDVAVVDPGEADAVRAVVRENDWRVGAVLLTHHHHDHVGGVADLIDGQSIPVFGPRSANLDMVTDLVEHDDVFTIPEIGVRMEVTAVPGHTRDHIAYMTDGAVFCGDALFSAGCGRLFEGSPNDLYHTMCRLRALPDSTLVYAAHEYTLGNLEFARAVEPDNEAIDDYLEYARRLRRGSLPTLPSFMALEKRVNPFLRFDQEMVQRAAKAAAGKALSSDVAVLAALREWKDRF